MMEINVPTCPCKECNYHSYDCHSTCFQYKEWAQLHELKKMQEDEARFKHRAIDIYKKGRRNAYEHHKNRSKRI